MDANAPRIRTAVSALSTPYRYVHRRAASGPTTRRLTAGQEVNPGAGGNVGTLRAARTSGSNGDQAQPAPCPAVSRRVPAPTKEDA